MKSTELAHDNRNNIADVQGSADSRQIPIDKVGIKDIRHPVRVKDRSVGEPRGKGEGGVVSCWLLVGEEQRASPFALRDYSVSWGQVWVRGACPMA